ncbi:AhpC/TSA antioxidant enzyme-domain-containing protein [Trametes punicea]|nr:AhpC/TSA antioxidant enzyme-domain-containing protein [Trametes punicea]
MASDFAHNALPSPEILAKAAQLKVYDQGGNEVTFGSLIQDQKTIVVFIRHFFCGSCQQFVVQLASVRKEALEQANARLVVVGCGDWKLIKSYCETTGYPYAIYADPSRSLYTTFGLIESLERTPAGQPKRSYIGKGFLGNVVKSIWDGPLKNPQFIGKQGNISQLGGDFIFGPGETCSYASRMKHTEDHVEVADLMKEAGVAYP